MTEEKPAAKPGPTLNNAQKKHLRGLGHHLEPMVMIGREGLSESVIQAVDYALLSHELIKVKIINTSSVNKHEAAEFLPAHTSSTLVQLIGKTLLLFRRNKKRKKEEQIKLP
mgnify:CR=1 FL=1